MSIMGTVRVHMSRSLDGFATGPDVSLGQPMGVGGERLHEWMFVASDATDIETAGGDVFYADDRRGRDGPTHIRSR
jgi:hypothetical protein